MTITMDDIKSLVRAEREILNATLLQVKESVTLTAKAVSELEKAVAVQTTNSKMIMDTLADHENRLRAGEKSIHTYTAYIIGVAGAISMMFTLINFAKDFFKH